MQFYRNKLERQQNGIFPDKMQHWSILFSLVAQTVKSLPATCKAEAQSPGWEGPLEEGVVTRSSILAWRMSWTEEPGRLQSTGSQSRTRLSD